MSAPDQGAGRRTGALEAVERIVNREEEADAVLGGVVAVLAERFEAYVAIRFLRDDDVRPRPSAGLAAPVATEVPIVYGGTTVGELVTSATLDRRDRDAFGRVAAFVSPFCIVR